MQVLCSSSAWLPAVAAFVAAFVVVVVVVAFVVVVACFPLGLRCCVARSLLVVLMPCFRVSSVFLALVGVLHLHLRLPVLSLAPDLHAVLQPLFPQAWGLGRRAVGLAVL